MFASKSTSTILIISMILLIIYTSNTNAVASCQETLDQSEVLRFNAEEACNKAAEIAKDNSADSTKAIAKKACDDAAIIARKIADDASAAAC